MADGDAKLFILLLMFFAAWTLFAGIMNMAYAGEITLEDMSALAGGTVPGQATADVSGGVGLAGGGTTGSVSQDFTTEEGWNDTYIFQGGGNALGPLWERDSNGFTCMNIPIYPVLSPAGLYGKGVVALDGHYITKYEINNPSASNPFYIVLYDEFGGVSSEGEWIRFDNAGFSRVESIGIDSVAYSVEFLTDYFGNDITTWPVPYDGANTGTTYQIDYSPNDRFALVYIDGVLAGQFSLIDPPESNSVYVGIATHDTGLNVKSIQFYTAANADTESSDWIGAIWNFLKTIWSAATQFGGMVGAAILLSNDALIPFAVWAVIGVPCIAGLIYLFLKLIRGGG